jgi:hypothetical protein
VVGAFASAKSKKTNDKEKEREEMERYMGEKPSTGVALLHTLRSTAKRDDMKAGNDTCP